MIERGERVAHVETLAALSEALGVSLSELFAIQMGNGSDANTVVQPLADFARSKGLTQKDIQKLLGVARAMFSGSSPESA
jgi:transcriptional regulator with XRE-family HTH domain